MLERIEAFKAGKHRSIDGQVWEFSEADVAAIAAGYDPALQAAPIVLGHPKTDDPAWGWAKGLSVDGGVLVVEPEKVDPAFADGVEAGRYRYVSSSFYTPEDPRNPKPGAWYLRHVGFLGATPPAVKGLAPAFSEADEAGVVSFAAEPADARAVENLFRGLRDWIIEKDGIELADRILPSWFIDSLAVKDQNAFFAEGAETTAGAEAASSPETSPGAEEPSAAAAPGEDVLTAREAAVAEREAAADRREAAFSEGARTQARTDDAVFLDNLVMEGRLPPVHRDRLATIMARLGGDQTVAFAEADADPRAELREVLSTLGVSIAFGEVSAGDGFDVTSADAGAAIASKISEIVAAAKARGETISYSQAAAQVGR